MTAEKLFQEWLGLGLNWEVVASRFERESGIVSLEIRETARLRESVRCLHDTGQVFCYVHTESPTWRHLNVFQHRCAITCRLPRGKCRQCGHAFRVRPPWEGLSTHFPKEFEAFALLLMHAMPMSQVAGLVGETDTRLWRMLFATEGKNHGVWLKFIRALETHNGHRHAVRQVNMDMSPAYHKGVKETCRNAQLVFDKFHVVMNVNPAVDQVRRVEVCLGAPGAGGAPPEPVAVAQEPGAPDGAGDGPDGRPGGEKSAHRQGVSDAAGVAGHLPQPHSGHSAAPLPRVVPVGAFGGPQGA